MQGRGSNIASPIDRVHRVHSPTDTAQDQFTGCMELLSPLCGVGWWFAGSLVQCFHGYNYRLLTTSMEVGVGAQ